MYKGYQSFIMLNIKDIKERNHIEPPEVTAIRENIIKSFSKLRFEEGPHIYYLKQDDGTEITLPSVSSMTHKFEPYVDWDMKAEKYALDHDLDKDYVVRMWEENNIIATNNGTSTHLFGEAYMHFFMGHPENIPPIIMPQYEKGYLIPYSQKQMAIMQFYTDMFSVDNIYPVMPEAQVYMGLNDDWKDITPYAGTFDMLFTYKAKDGKWKLLLYDWKTNKSLENSYAREHGSMALEPFSELYDESYSYYILQLSCYSLCLMQLGYEISDRKIVWLKDDGTYMKISVPDYTSRVRLALQK